MIKVLFCVESLHGPSSVEEEHSKEASPEQLSNQSLASRGSGLALVVDTEVTSYLMMGALSPGLKRHSVSLFEGSLQLLRGLLALH